VSLYRQKKIYSIEINAIPLPKFLLAPKNKHQNFSEKRDTATKVALATKKMQI
jgi:hypothetical protein